jgi:uncharacterized phage-associated protein
MTRTDAHDPRAIANRILQLRLAAGAPLTVMQLIKLVYIADGWAMALLGKPLSKTEPQAWQYGPVYPELYRAFKRFGPNSVTAPATIAGTDVPFGEEFTDEENGVIRSVVESYGKLSAYQLSNLTHQPNTPWSKAFANGAYSPISTAEMRSHFEELKAKQLAEA